MTTLCTVVEFKRTAGLYRAGDQAGFPANIAAQHVRTGAAREIARDTPIVSPAVIVNSAQATIAEIQRRVGQAETHARQAAGSNDAGVAATASASLDAIGQLREQIAALERQLGAASANPPDPTNKRQPPARQAA